MTFRIFSSSPLTSVLQVKVNDTKFFFVGMLICASLNHFPEIRLFISLPGPAERAEVARYPSSDTVTARFRSNLSQDPICHPGIRRPSDCRRFGLSRPGNKPISTIATADDATAGRCRRYGSPGGQFAPTLHRRRRAVSDGDGR